MEEVEEAFPATVVNNTGAEDVLSFGPVEGGSGSLSLLQAVKKKNEGLGKRERERRQRRAKEEADMQAAARQQTTKCG